ncbi:MAG: PrgI family protein [Candidatus Peregrinibacteria bacterium]|nr:PrgI family protein [Candidatus Peregrinibacteria bacterium]MCB9808279.1 PrgI family protein [Candidatus Peribacteria bacterium]
MTIDPVKIPQNVYIEDRIIGPVTLKQIMIIMISSGVSYALWAIMRSNGMASGIHTAIAWTPTLIGALFAFVKINGISLLRMVLLFLERIDKPARRVWMPHKGIYINIITSTPSKKEPSTHSEKKQQESQIEELSRVLDQGPPEPVQQDRIQVNKRKKPIDDISPAPSHA